MNFVINVNKKMEHCLCRVLGSSTDLCSAYHLLSNPSFIKLLIKNIPDYQDVGYEGIRNTNSVTSCSIQVLVCERISEVCLGSIFTNTLQRYYVCYMKIIRKIVVWDIYSIFSTERRLFLVKQKKSTVIPLMSSRFKITNYLHL